MKARFRNLLFFALLFVILGGVSVCFSQDDDEAGGYVKASVSDKNVVAAANFAVSEHGKKHSETIKLLKINSAQMQVVAGVNYELCMQVSVKEKDAAEATEEFIKAVVYRDLKNVFSLTSWAEDDCAE